MYHVPPGGLMGIKQIWEKEESRFLILFLVILAVFFLVVALQTVNDAVVVPYTTFVAKISGHIIHAFGEDLSINGCVLRSPRFAVTIYNGCNGLITSLIFIAGVLAFPASIKSKLLGVVLGLLAIQAVNFVRIVSLFYIGVFFPRFFNSSHVFIWQSIVILFGVGLWMIWAQKFGQPKGTGPTSSENT